MQIVFNHYPSSTHLTSFSTFIYYYFNFFFYRYGIFFRTEKGSDESDCLHLGPSLTAKLTQLLFHIDNINSK